MNKLEELIKEFCPNGVEYVKIGHICKSLPKGTLKTSELVEGGMYPVINAGKDLYGYYSQYNNNGDAFTLSSRGEYAGSVNYFENKFWAGGLCYPYTSSNPEICLTKFIYYYLKNIEKYIRYTMVAEGSIPALNKKDLQELQIPLPALPVQREIVRILDSFTLYSAELTAELTARRKQYEFYRDKLLTFEKTEVEQMPLGKLAKFTYGYTDVAKDVGDARFIRITDINEDGCLASGNCKYITLNDESKKYLLKEGDLLLARTGATYGKTLYFPNNEPAVYASFLIKIDLDNSVILNRYYWHFSKSNLYWKQADKYVSKAGQQQFNTNAVSRVIVPVPPIEVQERIVKVLDNFDEICSNLKIGLPAEMEKRQQQYEYYRDKLLEFNVNINKDINITGGGSR